MTTLWTVSDIMRYRTSHPDRSSVRGFFLVLLAATLWGTLAPVGKVLTSLGTDMVTTVFFRAFFCTMGATGFLVVRNPRALKVSLPEIPGLALFGCIGVGACYGGFFMALNTLSVALTEVVFYSYPLLIAAGSFFFTGEKPGSHQIIGGVLTLSGIALALAPSLAGVETVSVPGILWVLSASVGMATYSLMGRRGALEGETVQAKLFFYGLVFGTLSLALLKTATSGWNDLARGLPLTAWGAMLYLGLIASLIGYGAFYAGLRLVEATTGGVVGAWEVIVAISLGSLLSGKLPSLWELGGGGLIVLAIVVASGILSRREKGGKGTG